MKKSGKVVAHTVIVIGSQGFNIAVHQDKASSLWLMNLRPDTPSEKAEEVAMNFWKVMVTGDGWKTLREGKEAIGKAIKKTKAKWNGWHKETYD